MKVVVTGANGFVGARVIRELASRGDEVQAIVRGTSNRSRLRDLASLQVIEADVLSPAGRQTIASLEADACVHAAWCAEPGKYLSSPANIDFIGATLELARVLAQHGCRRFVGIGTCFEYDTEHGLLSERTPLRPSHLYSAAKAGTYLALKELGRLMDLEVAWARLFYLYGPDEHPARLISAIVHALLRGEEAGCTPGQQVRDFLHVDDAASAIGAVLHSDLVGAVNVGSGRPVTVASIAQQLGTICGRPDLVHLGARPYAPGDPMFVCADVQTLKGATGYEPRWSLTDGLTDVVGWWKSDLRA